MTQEMSAEQLKQAARDAWSEATFTREFIALARQYGWRVAHFRTVRVQRKSGKVYYETPVQGDGAGWPDVFLVKGFAEPSIEAPRMIVAELKVGRNKPTPEQTAWLEALSLFAEVYVWRPSDWDTIVSVLKG